MADSVTGIYRTVGVSVTRPSDTNAYTAGDVITTSTTTGPGYVIFDMVGIGANGGTIIQEAICIDSANQATKPDLELWLFNVLPTGTSNDNAAVALTDADLASFVGVIRFPTSSFLAGLPTSGAAGNSLCHTQNLSMPVNAANTGTTNANGNLWGVVIVRNAYTPVSGEIFTFKLKLID